MENGLTEQSIAKHYGYSNTADTFGCWKIEPGVLQKICDLPKVLDEAKNFRVVIDYDPNFTRMLVQIFEGKTS